MWVMSLMVMVGLISMSTLYLRSVGQIFPAAITSFVGVATNSFYLALLWVSPEGKEALGWQFVVIVVLFVYVEVGFFSMFFHSLKEIHNDYSTLAEKMRKVQSRLRDIEVERPRRHLGQLLDD